MSTILGRIVEHKHQEVVRLCEQYNQTILMQEAIPSDRDFLGALAVPGAQFILECKKASPSKGLIRADFNIEEIVAVYRHYASCISVLTDEHFFQGSFTYLQQVRAAVSQPVLCKDFIIHPIQILLARKMGADAVLLMLSVLSDDEYRQLAALASQLQMTVLTEVSNHKEAERAITLEAPLVGINNRDLRDLSINLETTAILAPLFPSSTVLISESGIHQHQQVMQLNAYVDGYLVGSSLMSEADLAAACHRLIVGEHKVCGLTIPENVQVVADAKFSWAGLIFYPKSPRYVLLEHAKMLVQQAKINFVGVFVDADIHTILEAVDTLNLRAVQLHGDESTASIQFLRERLPNTVEIWKAKAIADTLPELIEPVNRYLLDTYDLNIKGGTGKPFDWALLKYQLTSTPFQLAGGLNLQNLALAAQQPAIGLDLNSGLEIKPGVKDPQLIYHAMEIIQENK